MKRGNLRVLLGAAPGVGKTVEMLREGARLRDEGRDVVIGIVETHGRAMTMARTAGLELVPRARRVHHGVPVDDMDLDAILQRAPEVALVDELAHTNVSGSEHEKRWQDVEALRDAGIDVITTVNVQHIESLGDVVRQITGVAQAETVPDAVVRSADQVEVIDLAPQALRDRLTAGMVYPAERIDAALSNFFRLGNLTALRELALLWLADEVDGALIRYREQHGIEANWHTRERVVVALSGGSEGETLLRRGARIAARAAGGELIAVHVSGQDGLREGDPATLHAQRALADRLGGAFHSIVGDDVPRTLVSFAKSVDATQLVIGSSRRGRLQTALTGEGIGASVVREAGDIDVHMVQHAQAASARRLPRPGRGALSAKRVMLGFATALAFGPLLSWMLVTWRTDAAITIEVLAYQLLVVVVALIGGIWPALFAAVLSGLTLDFLFVAPIYKVTVSDPLHMVALALYVVIAILVSAIVDQAARRLRAAKKAAAEAELLATVAGSVVRGESAVLALVTRTREAFGATGVRLLSPTGDTIASDGEPTPSGSPARFDVSSRSETASPRTHPDLPAEARTAHPASGSVAERSESGPRGVLEVYGADLDATERRLLSAILAQLAGTLENAELAERARAANELAAADHVRSALLSAVSHDVRRPLAAAIAAIGGLRAAGPALAEHDRLELLDTASESLDALATLITDLLDVSRVQAGALAVRLSPVDLAAIARSSVTELGFGADQVIIALDAGALMAQADGVLLQRALVNLLANAERHSPAGAPVTLTTSALGDIVEIRVIDRGPGVDADKRETMFLPFQRLGDTDNTAGLGLGLALSRGFVEGMGGRIDAEDTPGGGLTMVVTLPAAPDLTLTEKAPAP